MKNKILILTGKSCAGKDSIMQYLMCKYNFSCIISHTTRPIRPSEIQDIDYHFLSNEEFDIMDKNNEFIEHRNYNTLLNNINQIWKYGIHKNEFLDKYKKYVCIVDIQGLRDLIKYFGRENIISFYIDVDDNIRRKRCVVRGDFDECEWNRRFEDDDAKFNTNTMGGIVNHVCFNENFIADCGDVINLIYIRS